MENKKTEKLRGKGLIQRIKENIPFRKYGNEMAELETEWQEQDDPRDTRIDLRPWPFNYLEKIGGKEIRVCPQCNDKPNMKFCYRDEYSYIFKQ